MGNIVSLPNTFSSGTIAKSSEVNENFSTITDAMRPTFVFTIVGTLTTGTSLAPTLISNNSLTIVKAYAYVKTAPTGADVLIDINVNGTSIWSVTPANRLTIPAGAADQAYTETSFDTVSLSDGDRITIDIDQVGSTVVGADLTVELRCE